MLKKMKCSPFILFCVPWFMSQTSSADVSIGSMFEFDCKPTAGDTTEDGWIPIAFEHQVKL